MIRHDNGRLHHQPFSDQCDASSPRADQREAEPTESIKVLGSYGSGTLPPDQWEAEPTELIEVLGSCVRGDSPPDHREAEAPESIEVPGS
jgi:hypothetical protein